ncbi:MAG TPA: hypothetical protein VJW76_14215 [Verrucomicrobiae bacterium]|nr:hypothetical protein [Verrucomicrobiae bacterium]
MTVTLASLVRAAPLPVLIRNGEAHVAAAVLEREAGVVVKRLPGRAEFVVCGRERCAPLKSVLADGNDWLVPVAPLCEAMNLTANFDENRRHVALILAPRESSATTGLMGVGGIAPNLRLTKLDGTPVSLDELRGQRVLINSWASW